MAAISFSRNRFSGAQVSAGRTDEAKQNRNRCLWLPDNCPVCVKFYEGAKQRIEDRILAKPYDQIITLIESYNESPKPESRKLKPKDRGSDTKSINVKLEMSNWTLRNHVCICGIQICVFLELNFASREESSLDFKRIKFASKESSCKSRLHRMLWNSGFNNKQMPVSM